MKSRPVFRDRETRFNDAQQDRLLKTSVRQYETGKSVEGLLVDLIRQTNLSNLIAITGNDMFTMEQRKAAMAAINEYAFEPGVLHPGGTDVY